MTDNDLYMKIVSLYSAYGDREEPPRPSSTDVYNSFDMMNVFFKNNAIMALWDNVDTQPLGYYANKFLNKTNAYLWDDHILSKTPAYLWNNCIFSHVLTDSLFFGSAHHVFVIGNDVTNMDSSIEKLIANKHRPFIAPWTYSDTMKIDDDKLSLYVLEVKS